MMISAFAMLFLCVFGFSLFIQRRASQSVFLFGFSATILSLYMAWFVFVASYYSDLGAVMPAFALLGAAIAIVLLFRRVAAGGITLPQMNGQSDQRLIYAAIGIGALLIALESASGVGQVFSAWDAVVSWNRWAMELSQNRYNPMNAAYPVLLPGVWSLTYEALGTTEIWYFARATLPLLALGVFALIAHVGVRRGLVGYLALFVPAYFAFFSKVPLYSGYMDQPSAILGMAAMILVFLALSTANKSERNEYLWLAVIGAALAVLTKQHAIFAAFAVCSVVGIHMLLRRLSLLHTAGLALVFLAPVATFLVIYLAEQDSLWGNLATLNQTTVAATAGRSEIIVALQRIGGELPWPVWLLIAVGLASNLAGWRDPRAWFAGFITLLTVPGFLVYADCCSYSERNGMWILGHLIVASFIGFSLLAEIASRRASRLARLAEAGAAVSGSRLSTGQLAGGMAAILLIVGFVIIEWPYERLIEQHEAQLRQDLAPRVHSMAQANPELFSSASVIVTPVQPLRYHPDFTGRTEYCRSAQISCFANKPLGRTLFITADWFENPTSKALIDAMIANGSLVLKAQAGGQRTYLLEGLPPQEAPAAIAAAPAGPRVDLRLREDATPIEAVFVPTAWRARSGGAPNALVTERGVFLEASRFAISVDALPAVPGARYKITFTGEVVRPGQSGAPLTLMAGPVALSETAEILVYWGGADIADAVREKREGGEGVFSGERIITAPEGAHSIHLAFHGPWSRTDPQSDGAVIITSAQLERLAEEAPED